MVLMTDFNREPDSPAARRAEIEARWQAATKGPWIYGADPDQIGEEDAATTEVTASDNPICKMFDGAGVIGVWSDTSARELFEKQGENGRAIAHAPEDVAWLIAELRRLTAPGDPEAERVAFDKAYDALKEACWRDYPFEEDARAFWDTACTYVRGEAGR